MKRRIVIVIVSGLVLLVTSTAAQAAVGISLSRDGVHWSNQLSSPLFADGTRWVPGDRRIETFYVRNDSDEPAELLIDIQNSAVRDLLDTGDMSIEARSEGPWIPIVGTDKHRLVSQSAVDAGESRRVDVAVQFDRVSDNQSQVLQLKLRFGVRLIDADVVVRGDDGEYTIGDGGDDEGSNVGGGAAVGTGSIVESVSDRSQSLPDTGAGMTLLVPVVGAICLLGGFLVVTHSRHRRGASS